MVELSTPQQQLYGHKGRRRSAERKAVLNRSTVGGFASVICKKTRFHFHLTSCLVRTGLWKPVKGVTETQSGSLSRVKGSGSVYSCQFSLVSRSPNEFLAQNLSERQIPDSSIIRLWRQITSVLTKTGGIRMGPSEGLCGRGRKKVAVIW